MRAFGNEIRSSCEPLAQTRQARLGPQAEFSRIQLRIVILCASVDAPEPAEFSRIQLRIVIQSQLNSYESSYFSRLQLS